MRMRYLGAGGGGVLPQQWCGAGRVRVRNLTTANVNKSTHTYTSNNNITTAVHPILFDCCTPQICQSVLKQCVFCLFFEAGSYWILYSSHTYSWTFHQPKSHSFQAKISLAFIKRDLEVSFFRHLNDFCSCAEIIRNELLLWQKSSGSLKITTTYLLF